MTARALFLLALSVSACTRGDEDPDAGPGPDASMMRDARVPDARLPDARPPDARIPDGGSRDGGAVDASADGGPCPFDLTRCDGVCYDTSSHPTHCGGCDTPCDVGETCTDGVCVAPPATWDTDVSTFACPADIDTEVTFVCPPAGTEGYLYGTDVYTDDSSVCTAAVHAGRITFLGGGTIRVRIVDGRAAYTGTTRFGVTSFSTDFGTDCSFEVIEPTTCEGMDCGGSCVDTMTDRAHCGGCTTICPDPQVCTAGSCGAYAADWLTRAADDYDCADPGVIGSRHEYACPAGGTAGSVWGTDTYTHDSSLCTAAVHVGRITLATGGVVTVELTAGEAAYTGSTRNGITSSSYGSWTCSIVFR